ncbi:cysteine desulfurase DndA [Massilia sp. KIM]|uniref:cysteine desulfurase DndA n=1 Tax=Massilia sp. KIM TaxID=1955422 RepID=UPI00098E8CCB|nr:cysteine desulfurase DndA [Massilia sp. KIM]OON62700.1 cysteine desulfurase DndA [Massilia sp. KIM]
MSTYLDCNATTPVESEVLDAMVRYLTEEYGNAGSRTHEFGVRAKQAVERAREQVAAVVAARRDDVIFTSGATESNNIVLLGLANSVEGATRRHIVSTAIEHKAVLEPLEHLVKQGFEVTLISPDESGRIDAQAVLDAVRSDTLLVSVMHANNETGVVQPIEAIAAGLSDAVWLHVDAAQTFGKLIAPLQNSRIDLISVSAHKIFGPKGIGALVSRRREGRRAPLSPLMFGGGQERGVRPGTQAVHLIAGFGVAAQMTLRDHEQRQAACLRFRDGVLTAMAKLGGRVNGDREHCLPHVLNVSLPGLNSEAAMVTLKGVLALSNGSACTSTSYEPSHVLVAMGLGRDRIESALRLSWCHLTPEVDWPQACERLRRMM